MKRQDIGLSVLVTLVGAGLGIGGMLLAMRPPVVLDSPAQAPSAPGDAAECTRLQGAVEAELADLAAEQERLDFTEALMRGQLGPIGGIPSLWPPDVDPQWTEAAMRTRLEKADDEVDVAEVLELDCSEFPCLALVETTGSASTHVGITTGVDAGGSRRTHASCLRHAGRAPGAASCRHLAT